MANQSISQKTSGIGTSLVVQWLRLCASTAGGMGSIPGKGSSTCHSHKRKKKKTMITKKFFTTHVTEIIS